MPTAIDLPQRRALSPLAQLKADAERRRTQEDEAAELRRAADARAAAQDRHAETMRPLETQQARQSIEATTDKQNLATMQADIGQSIQDPALIGKSFRQLDPYYRQSFADRYPRVSGAAQVEWDEAQRRNTGAPVGIPGLEEGESVAINPQGGVTRQIAAGGDVATRISDKDLALAGVDPRTTAPEQRSTALAAARQKAIAPQALAEEKGRVRGLIEAVQGFGDIQSQLGSTKEPGMIEKAAIVQQARPAEGVVSSVMRQTAQKAVSPEAMKFEALRNRINSMMLFAGGGKALTDTEKSLLTAIEPDDSIAVMREKLGVVVPLMRRELASIAASYPGQFKEAERVLAETEKAVGDPATGKPQDGAPQAPKPGEVRRGYRFKGGNPADRNAWEPVQ